MRKVKVLQILHGLSRAGAARLVFDLAVRNRDSLETEVVCLDQEGPLADQLREQGIDIHPTRRHEGIDLTQIVRISRIIKNFRPHVVHCHQYTPFFYGTLASMWARSGQVLFTEHGRHYPDIVSSKRRFFNRFLLTRTSGVTAVCDFSRRRLVENEGIPFGRIEVVYNGVDVSRFARTKDPIGYRLRFDLPENARVIVQVGNFRKVKDQTTAIQAFQKVREQDSQACLIFVGDGPDLNECRQLAQTLKVDHAIRFLGQRDDIPEILAGADIMLMTSLSEAHSVSLLEGMATRLPIVATKVGGIPETIVDNQTGFLAEPKNADALARSLLMLLKDADLRDRMGQAGFNRVLSQFQQTTMHEKYLSIYHRLAEGKQA